MQMVTSWPGYYKDTEQVLGKTFGMCHPCLSQLHDPCCAIFRDEAIFDTKSRGFSKFQTHRCILQDFEALTPNLLCRVVETVENWEIVGSAVGHGWSLIFFCIHVCHLQPETDIGWYWMILGLFYHLTVRNSNQKIGRNIRPNSFSAKRQWAQVQGGGMARFSIFFVFFFFVR